MFFLLRMAFWLGIVLVLLSTGTAHRGASTSKVGPADAASAASATVHDLEGFCTREPNACTVGSQLAASMGNRARVGAKMLYDFLTASLAARDTGQLDSADKSPAQRGSQDTLTPTDLAPAWRGPPVHEAGRHSA